ncbi:hypothetical protein Tco_0858875 [Tanacetum coccineum]|uniref:Uncharacterized protein n=1 Tax=Tanacetum coccineum TaxID=301880 RepID=A0ABQ5BDD6_9ASTR
MVKGESGKHKEEKGVKVGQVLLEELTDEIGLDDSIPTEIDDGYYDSEVDILFLKHLLIEETFSDPTPAVLPKKYTLLVTPPPASKQFRLKEVEIFDLFFSLTQSGGKTRVIETLSFGFHHMPSPRPTAYSPKKVMYIWNCSEIKKELTDEIGLDDSIPNEIDDGYYDSEGDILFLEHLLIEETFSDPTPAMLPKKSTLLATQPPASKQF